MNNWNQYAMGPWQGWNQMGGNPQAMPWNAPNGPQMGGNAPAYPWMQQTGGNTPYGMQTGGNTPPQQWQGPPMSGNTPPMLQQYPGMGGNAPPYGPEMGGNMPPAMEVPGNPEAWGRGRPQFNGWGRMMERLK